MFPDEQAIALIFIFFFGLAFGSFVTLVSYRLPRGEDIIFKPSQCPKCKTRLGFFDLFPVFSWLFNSGKCGYCGKKVSARYPLIELVLGIIFVVTYLKFGNSLNTIIFLLLSVCLLTVVVADLEQSVIPNQLIIAMLVIGIIYRLLPDSFSVVQIIFGPVFGIIFGLLLRKIFSLLNKNEALGLGDIKFLAVVGIFLQKETIITFLFLVGVIGILTAVFWNASGKGRQFPFAPALAGSLYFCVLMAEILEKFEDYVLNEIINFSF